MSGGQFYVFAFGISLALIAVKMFSHSIYFINKFCKYRTCSAICKHNVAVNNITVSHKTSLSPVNSGQSYAIVRTHIIVTN
jgi:hypothetical protein